jgi:hypothetical protein
MTYAFLVSPVAQRRLPWMLSLITASVLFSFAAACATPLAAFAAIAVLTFSRRVRRRHASFGAAHDGARKVKAVTRPRFRPEK